MKRSYWVASCLSLSLCSTAFAQEPVENNGLHADWYPGDNSTAVIVLHGTLAHKRMEIIETLSSLFNEDYDYPVLAPNLALNQPDRAGMVDCALPHDHQHMDAVDELAGWVDWLEAKGYEQIAILGHSRGGAQVAKYLTQAADSVVAAALVAPATYDADKAIAGYDAATGQSLDTLLASAAAMPGSKEMTVPRFVYCENATVTAAAFLGYHQPNAEFDTPTLLESVQVPVQIFIGSEDRVVEDLAEKLAERDLPDTLQTVTVAGADHFFRDLYADDVVAEFAEFLDR